MSKQVKQLFQVEFRVHPTREHPCFEQIKFGILRFWLFEFNEEGAFKKAVMYARDLPYRLGAGKSFSVDKAENLQDWETRCASSAYEIPMFFVGGLHALNAS